MCSARRLMVFNVYVKFHENMSSGFKVMELTRKLLTHTEETKTLCPHGILCMPGYNDIKVIEPTRFLYGKLQRGIILKKKCRWSDCF